MIMIKGWWRLRGGRRPHTSIPLSPSSPQTATPDVPSPTLGLRGRTNVPRRAGGPTARAPDGLTGCKREPAARNKTRASGLGPSPGSDARRRRRGRAPAVPGGFESGGGRRVTGEPGRRARVWRVAAQLATSPPQPRVRGRRAGLETCGGWRCGRLQARGWLGSAAAAFSGPGAGVAADTAPSLSS